MTPNAQYIQLLQSFINAGYNFLPFISAPPPSKALLLRHDVDFSVDYALRLAQIEQDYNIQSTYFFLLRSKMYNLLAEVEKVRQIQAAGHWISLHFDPAMYPRDHQNGLAQEMIVFQDVFSVALTHVSIHRPPNAYTQNGRKLQVRHTYEADYCKNIAYFSDSMGQFRYGHPLDSDTFKNGRSMQLLLHPIWWLQSGNGPIEKIKGFFDLDHQMLASHVAENCKPFREFYNV